MNCVHEQRFQPNRDPSTGWRCHFASQYSSTRISARLKRVQEHSSACTCRRGRARRQWARARVRVRRVPPARRRYRRWRAKHTPSTGLQRSETGARWHAPQCVALPRLHVSLSPASAWHSLMSRLTWHSLVPPHVTLSALPGCHSLVPPRRAGVRQDYVKCEGAQPRIWRLQKLDMLYYF